MGVQIDGRAALAVVGIGNAIVDVLAPAPVEVVARAGLDVGTMTLAPMRSTR
jgi:hypothetical protein